MVIGNSIEFVVVMFAIIRFGAVSVPLNIRHKCAENEKSSATAEPRWSFTKRTPRQGSDGGVPPSLKMPSLLHSAAHSCRWPNCWNVARDYSDEVEEEETATILYTSGTTAVRRARC